MGTQIGEFHTLHTSIFIEVFTIIMYYFKNEDTKILTSGSHSMTLFLKKCSLNIIFYKC